MTSPDDKHCEELLRQLVLDCQADLAAYIVPDSGISEHDVVNTLLGRLDGSQSREALAAPSAEPAEEERYTIPTTELFSAPRSSIGPLSAVEHLELPRDELEAAEAFVKTLLPRADEMKSGFYPLWHGWALRDAFWAGAAFARSATLPREASMEMRKAVGTIVSDYAAKLIWQRMYDVAMGTTDGSAKEKP